MTDKEKILTAIQKRMEFQKTCIKNDYRLTGKAEKEIIFEYQKLINFIDSIQEEPVSEDLEEAVNAYIGYTPEVDESSSTYGKRQAFKAGANWQKQKMLAKAVDGVVHHLEKCGVASVHYTDPIGAPMAYYISPEGLSAGDKVKIIVIKEN